MTSTKDIHQHPPGHPSTKYRVQLKKSSDKRPQVKLVNTFLIVGFDRLSDNQSDKPQPLIIDSFPTVQKYEKKLILKPEYQHLQSVPSLCFPGGTLTPVAFSGIFQLKDLMLSPGEGECLEKIKMS
jgi:hypothetical protein